MGYKYLVIGVVLLLYFSKQRRDQVSERHPMIAFFHLMGHAGTLPMLLIAVSLFFFIP